MRKTIKRVMAKAMPVYLVEEVNTELRLAAKRMFTDERFTTPRHITFARASAAASRRISKATTGVPKPDTIGEQKCAAAQTIAKASRERRDPPSRVLRSDRL